MPRWKPRKNWRKKKKKKKNQRDLWTLTPHKFDNAKKKKKKKKKKYHICTLQSLELLHYPSLMSKPVTLLHTLLDLKSPESNSRN